MIATLTQESEAGPAPRAGLASPHGRAKCCELAPLSGAEGCGAAKLLSKGSSELLACPDFMLGRS